MFYGARQFGIRDLNGYELYFIGDLYAAGVIGAFISWPGTLSLRSIRFDRCQRDSRASTSFS